MILKNVYRNKKIIITGHTGFKGSWLSAWLILLGAKVIGISDKFSTNPSHFKSLKIKRKIRHYSQDIRNLKMIKKIFIKHKPDYVFHLAAQPLVKTSYVDPIKTFETNMLGTLNVLESLKFINKKCTAVIITSDKVYKNFEIKKGYKESDKLGGYDPYSASKASAELIIQSYIKSYFFKKKNIFIGIARAGNVIGGGDWSENRLIPDCVKSWSKNKTVSLRNPQSTRPWQHVLESLWGYLLLSLKLEKNKKLHGEAFNFGPDNKSSYDVYSVVKLMGHYWKNVRMEKIKKKKGSLYESGLLKLNSNKAKKLLKWKTILTFDETIKLVADWYKNYYSKQYTSSITFSQIKLFMSFLKQRSF